MCCCATTSICWSEFAQRFQRIEIDSELYGMRLVHYIHFNPQKHGFVADFREYPHSSYQAMLSETATRLQRDEVLEWFGGRGGFEGVHRTLADEKDLGRMIIEED
jgi:putative transposase